MRRDDVWLLLPVVALAALPALAFLEPAPPSTAAVTGINPVRVEINGHPANSGFLAVVEQNISLDADESEGTWPWVAPDHQQQLQRRCRFAAARQHIHGARGQRADLPPCGRRNHVG